MMVLQFQLKNPKNNELKHQTTKEDWTCDITTKCIFSSIHMYIGLCGSQMLVVIFKKTWNKIIIDAWLTCTKCIKLEIY